MRKQCLFYLTLLTVVLVGCGEKEGVCHIQGTLPNEKYNGKYIYLIAEDRTIRDSVGIDSVMVENQRFEFETTKHMMCIIRMDWHYRFGLQDLLIVAEPGEVQVTIDSVSSGGGTPNNDVLQQWKQLTEVHGKQYGQLISFYQDAHFSGDSVRAKTVKAHADSVHTAYKERTRQMAAGLPEGPLKDFLGSRYPTSYQRRLPDGTVEEVPID